MDAFTEGQSPTKIPRVANENGFSIVYLEDYRRRAGGMFNEADDVAVHGAALTNIIYAKKNANIVEIGHERGSPECFEILAKELGLTNYVKIKTKGWFSEEEERRLEQNTGMSSTNLLPLLFSDEIVSKLSSF